MISVNARSPLFVMALVLAPLAAVQAPAAPEKSPLREPPYTPSLDPKAMDRAANPCQDFHQCACGGWVRNNPIPARPLALERLREDLPT